MFFLFLYFTECALSSATNTTMVLKFILCLRSLCSAVQSLHSASTLFAPVFVRILSFVGGHVRVSVQFNTLYLGSR